MKHLDRNITDYRNQIEKIDYWILQLLSQRSMISKEIGLLKAKTKTKFFDKKREKNILKKNIESGKNLDLEASFVEDFTKLLLVYSKRIQNTKDS